MNLNSNFLLIGLILVSITCIYLLYININRSNETDSIKQNIKVLISQNKKRDEILNYVIDKLDTLNNKVITNNTTEQTVYNSQFNEAQQNKAEENNVTETDVVTEEQVQLENELYDVQTLYTENLQKQSIDTTDNETNYNSLLSSVTNNVNLGNDIYSDENNNFVRMSSSTENDEEHDKENNENNETYHNEGDDEGDDKGDDEGDDKGDDKGDEFVQLNERNHEHNNNDQLDLDDINLNELDIENEFTELLNNSDANGFVMEQLDVTTKITSDIPVEQNVVVDNLNDIVLSEEVSQEEVSQNEVSLEEKLKNILEQENISLNPSETESESEDIYSLPRNVNVLKNKYSADKLKNFAKTLNIKQTGTKKEIAERIITELNNSPQ